MREKRQCSESGSIRRGCCIIIDDICCFLFMPVKLVVKLVSLRQCHSGCSGVRKPQIPSLNPLRLAWRNVSNLHCSKRGVCVLFVLIRSVSWQWRDPAVQTGQQEAASERDASEHENEWPGLTTCLSCKFPLLYINTHTHRNLNSWLKWNLQDLFVLFFGNSHTFFFLFKDSDSQSSRVASWCK